MKRALNLLLVSFLLVGGITLQYGCGASEPSVEEQQPVDTDGDGLTDAEEMELGTDANSADTDGDGLSDAEEQDLGTDALSADTDGDGLNDGPEVNSYGTDPNNPDTDGDGLQDGEEVNDYRTDPTNADSDGDGLNDYDEVMTHNTDPNNVNSDGDGFTDSQEIEMGTDPNDPEDPAYIREGDLGTINFDFDKSNIDEQAASILSENVRMLTNAPNFRVRIDAYTDHIGGDQYNLRLSKRRAASTVKFYIENGIDSNRIDSRGLGKAPVPCYEQTEEIGCRKNRRSESHPISPYQYSPSN